MLASFEKCSGCGSCRAACPNNCITMAENREGFRYPQIDMQHCIECGLCREACPILCEASPSAHVEILAARNRDTKVRMLSSSGGVFTALAEKTMEAGGVVCAAAYAASFDVCHVIAESTEELWALRGAKYTQSAAEQCYPRIRQLLEDERQVLFVGTPCQTAGLKAFLGKAYNDLLLVDMICHGVPAPAVWRKYLQEQTEKTGSSLRSVNLRSKVSGWSRYRYSVEFVHENGVTDTKLQNQDRFMRGFVGDLYLRPSCSNCSFKGVARCSDLTLGDCWGIWETHPEFDDDKGVSLLMIQSEKGRRVWDAVKDAFDHMPLEQEEAVRYNPSTVQSAAAHPRRTEFFDRLDKGERVTELVEEILLPKVQKKSSLLGRIKRRLFSGK